MPAKVELDLSPVEWYFRSWMEVMAGALPGGLIGPADVSTRKKHMSYLIPTVLGDGINDGEDVRLWLERMETQKA